MNSFKDSRLAVVRLSDDEHEVIILDQTRLPGHEEYLRISDEERAWTAIKRLTFSHSATRTSPTRNSSLNSAARRNI